MTDGISTCTAGGLWQDSFRMRTQLRRVPIVEALIELQLVLPDGFQVDTFNSFHERIRPRYPNSQKHFTSITSVALGPPEGLAPAQTSSRHDGFLFRSADGHWVVQTWQDRFVVSRLKPYERWEALRDEARSLWSDFAAVAAPQRVSRLAVRYINRIEVPLPVRDLKDYFLTGPDIGPGLAQEFAGYLLRLVTTDAHSRATVIVTQASEPITPDGCVVPIVFDIEVSRLVDLAANDPTMWEGLESLRNVKNRVFFESLTPKALSLYQ